MGDMPEPVVLYACPEPGCEQLEAYGDRADFEAHWSEAHSDRVLYLYENTSALTRLRDRRNKIRFELEHNLPLLPPPDQIARMLALGHGYEVRDLNR